MRRRLTALLSLLIIPSVASAQRGARSRATSRSDLFPKDTSAPRGPALRVRDIEDMSPLKLLVDKRKDLKLTDAQISAFKDAESKLKEHSAPLFKSVDSLIREMKQASGVQSESDRIKAADARHGLVGVLDQITSSYDTAAKEAVATLDAEQQTKANELLAKQREEGLKTVRERSGAGGGRRGSEPPR